MTYAQHQSNYNAFFSVRKTYPQASDSNPAVHFFSKQMLPGLQTSTRFYKNRNGEWLQLTGTFLDGFNEVNVTNIEIQEPKELDNGTKIPEQIVVDLVSPVPGKVDRIQMTSDSSWGNDLARKIVNADLTKPLTIKPFSFVPEDSDKRIEGFSIQQNGEKLQDKYKEKDKKGNVKNINGVEIFDDLSDQAKATENAKLRSKAWQTYYASVNVFLIEKMMEFVNQSNFTPVTEAKTEDTIEYPDDEINPDDIPF
jgi:hypothetical protein